MPLISENIWAYAMTNTIASPKMMANPANNSFRIRGFIARSLVSCRDSFALGKKSTNLTQRTLCKEKSEMNRRASQHAGGNPKNQFHGHDQLLILRRTTRWVVPGTDAV